jgi:hypothetical protein
MQEIPWSTISNVAPNDNSLNLIRLFSGNIFLLYLNLGIENQYIMMLKEVEINNKKIIDKYTLS